MRVLGIDLATEPKGTAACWLKFEGAKAEVELVEHRLDDKTLVALLASADRTAIDSPFGWPEPFLAAITRWRDDGLFPNSEREPLRLRATDLYVKKETGLTPLSVSADKIGALAMRCSLLLTLVGEHERAPLDRVNGKVIECYPSAALRRFGFERAELKGMKDKKGSVARLRLLNAIQARAPWLQLDEALKHGLARVGDKFDAFVAALVARATALDLTDQPPKEMAAPADLEGWIHLPKPEALRELRRAEWELERPSGLASNGRGLLRFTQHVSNSALMLEAVHAAAKLLRAIEAPLANPL
jgi:predicted nuclease with RNAse H fold